VAAILIISPTFTYKLPVTFVTAVVT
jgi:hypothetical protein